MTFVTPQPGTAGQVYTAAAHNVIVDDLNYLYTPPMCKLKVNATQSLPNGTDTMVTFGASDFDTDTMGTTGASARITINTAGVYLVTYSVGFAAGTPGGGRFVTIAKNGTGSALNATGFGWNGAAGSTSLQSMVTNAVTLSLAATDYLQINAWQSSGGNLNIGAIPESTFFSVVWIGKP